ncbi:chemotaxis protein CheB [Luteimonas sp. e5]
MASPDTRTVLLARPGAARERMRSALVDAGVVLAGEFDPLQVELAELAGLGAGNLVIVVDQEVDDALDRLVDVLEDPRWRILFEEEALVMARDGWDAARWSRHLGAKLLGHGDVLPAGHEQDSPAADEVPGESPADAASAAPPAAQVTADPGVAVAADVTDEAEDADEALPPGKVRLRFEAAPWDGRLHWQTPEPAQPGTDALPPARDATASDPDLAAADTDTARDEADAWDAPPEIDPGPAWGLQPVADHAPSTMLPDAADERPAAGVEVGDFPDEEALAALAALPTDPVGVHSDAEALSQPEVPAAAESAATDLPAQHDPPQDWRVFQDFDAIDELASASPDSVQRLPAFSVEAPTQSTGTDEDDYLEHLGDEFQRFQSPSSGEPWHEPVADGADEEDESAAVVGGDVPPADALPAATDWQLSDEPLASVEAAPADAAPALAGLESRIAGLSLLDEDAPPPLHSAVVIAAGIGGPDALRQLLQRLDEDFQPPLLIQQWLDGGHYDRLVRQMARTSSRPVVLAEAGQVLQAGHAYVLPPGIGVGPAANGGLGFIEVGGSSFADVLEPLQAAQSGAIALSGAGSEFVERTQRFRQAGGRVLAQAADGCYDHAVPALLIARGAEAHVPGDLATRIAALWRGEEQA